MAKADFKVDKNLQVAGTGTSSFEGTVTIAGSSSVGGSMAVGGAMTVGGSDVVTSAVANGWFGQPNGVATLDAGGLVPVSQLPASAKPGGNDNSLQYKTAAGAFGGTDGVEIDATGCLSLLSTVTPATPASDRLTLMSVDNAGRIIPAFMGPAGDSTRLQASFANNKVGQWIPTGNATTITANGLTTPTIAGTATARNVATTNRFTATRRVGLVSGGVSGSSTSARVPALQFWRGNAAGLGGFFFVSRFGISDASSVADARMFVGLYSSAGAIGNADPTTLLNVVGIGCDNAETTLRIIHNDGSGTATSVNLGASFPSNTRNTDLYEFTLYAPANAAFINYLVVNLSTGASASGQLTTNLPVSTQLLAPHVWRNNGATGTAVGIDLVSLYIETDY